LYFANIWLLSVAATLVVPVLIHLWRRRRGEVRWAAMSLLKTALQRQSRTRRWSHWLLLLLRCVCLILLAIAVAAPFTVVESRESLMPEQTKVLNVIVLDDSLSMRFGGTGVTAFEDAQRQVIDLIEESHAGDAFCIIRMSDPHVPLIGQPSFDLAAVSKAVQIIEPTEKVEFARQSIANAFGLAKAHIDDKRFDRTSIKVYSDFTGDQWSSLDQDREFSQMAQSEVFVSLIKCGDDVRPNIAVTRLDCVDSVIGVQDITISCDLVGFDLEQTRSEQLRITLNDEIIYQQMVDISPNESSQIELNCRIDQPGYHRIVARIGEDDLNLDNYRFKIVRARASANVLLVEGRKDEAKTLGLALEIPDQGDKQFTATISGFETWKANRLDGFDIVAFCNVPEFSGEDIAAIEQVLASGTSVIVSVGDLVNSNNYNLAKQSNGTLLFPIEFLGPSQTERVYFDPLDYNSEVIAQFKRQPDAGLLDTPIWRYFNGRIRREQVVNRILGFGNGDPAIVASSRPTSQLIVYLGSWSQLSVDRSSQPPVVWTMIDQWPSFVPLVKRLFTWSISNQDSGQMCITGGSVDGDLSNSARDINLVGRNGVKVQCTKSVNGTAWTSDAIEKSGCYQLEIDGEIYPPEYAVNVPSAECDTRSVDQTQFAQRFQFANDNVAEQMTYTVQKRQWMVHPFVWALLLAVCVETIWMWRIDRLK
jgi:hypothetical protein